MLNTRLYTIEPPFLTTPGGAGGRRIVTVAFTDWKPLPKNLHARITVAVDLDAAEYNNDQRVRRRAARALVPAAKRYAAAIRSGTESGEVVRSPQRGSVCDVVFMRIEEVEGLERRLRVTIDTPLRPDQDDTDVSALAAPTAAALLTRLAEQVHATIDDPGFVHVYGV